MKRLIIFFSFFSFIVVGQEKLVPLQSFYKENFLRFSFDKSITTFYPQNESELNTFRYIRDTSLQYFEFTEKLYKHHLVELKADFGQINIDPLIHFSKGKSSFHNSSYTSLSDYPLFRNTRGLYIDGQIYKKTSFQFTFAENQAVFQDYEKQYMSSRGELYIFPGPRYSIQNAVVPGGSRTKPFKEIGYDYAYSTGVIRYAFHKKSSIESGNNQHFIGSGYRSLLLSDNSFYAPNLRLHWKINPKFEYQILYQKNLNLYRKPLTKAVESNYETKFYALTYLTYKPVSNFSISLFTAGNQLLADSMVRHPYLKEQLIPLPFFQNDLVLGNTKRINGITGLNFDFALKSLRLYAQIATDKVNNSILIANQLGFYWFDPFKIKHALIQFEWNQVPKNFYADKNPKLSYSQFNLPSAHPKGNNFNELFLKLYYEKNRMYIQAKTSFYLTQGGLFSQEMNATSIFNGLKIGSTVSGQSIVGDYEAGFRFNRLYNGVLYLKYQGRAGMYNNIDATFNCFWIGLKTSLSNEYFDF